jgi:phenazine biosynthesis protein phzE
VVSRSSTSPSRTGVPEADHIAGPAAGVRSGRSASEGFEAHDDGTPLVVVDVDSSPPKFTVAGSGRRAIDDVEVAAFADRGGFGIDDEVRQARRGRHRRRGSAG